MAALWLSILLLGEDVPMVIAPWLCLPLAPGQLLPPISYHRVQEGVSWRESEAFPFGRLQGLAGQTFVKSLTYVPWILERNGWREGRGYNDTPAFGGRTSRKESERDCYGD